MNTRGLELRVGEEADGMRLDRFLSEQMSVPRSVAEKLVEEGKVRVGTETVRRKSTRLGSGDVVVVEALPSRESELPSADPGVAFGVVYEDDDIVVVDKPAGIVVHPGSGVRSGTLVSGLLSRYPEIATVGDPARPGIVHRLDKGTSGLLVVARNPRSHRVLVEAIARRRIQRLYLALVVGHMPEPLGMIEAPIGRSRVDRTKMGVTATGREAATCYRRLERFDVADLLEVTLVTGRTHQIRVHMAAVGHPVVGDTTYGSMDRLGLPLARPFLHAHELVIPGDVLGRELRFRSPLPDDLAGVLEVLRRRRSERSRV
ncbi:MAG: pseudouridine synthase [Acidimicrobiales bacterium]|nr:MAG: pseudouridine synthase [Acidimicrobiales bacterium]